ncbi:SRPBCC family protein [Meiothermus sp. CFH 77666]|uniref:SRPBCC family protein n=1 Tax=Meiothermus sp. CFH 77666 TaxID=2817942 RepID=UPI001AA06B27|nr:SRPBCC family protein [Meiothermus sp. CFH 77666]MBO1436108.1 SRPBCC family protein [Meiothermus sp. CFH 77666]
MNIDNSAPLKARKEIVIGAPLETVWALLTDIERWPQWQPDVSSARLEGELAVGAVFRWKAKGLGIVSTVQALEQGRCIGWTGNSVGMRAVHIWTLEPQGEGVRVATEESLTGWLAQTMKIFDRNFLEKSLEGSLQVLKARAERR